MTSFFNALLGQEKDVLYREGIATDIVKQIVIFPLSENTRFLQRWVSAIAGHEAYAIVGGQPVFGAHATGGVMREIFSNWSVLGSSSKEGESEILKYRT